MAGQATSRWRVTENRPTLQRAFPDDYRAELRQRLQEREQAAPGEAQVLLGSMVRTLTAELPAPPAAMAEPGAP